ncbi:hypothetical protein [Cupriavidus sp.]|uniref:hypothetical protein n=1 Tax=Cupriavidus sp. TaxID=1873897 RepID=UPI0025BCDCAA|nr:hypothetical protein [Cupriavidus sp.]MCA3186673.1 hypothetical protein [Cupriavidus sp.]MCA3194564.1 hypothetical protein [Cupriavidus sp.]MCA3197904.1 hypothetical protein [Cupriavidus sp.]MCA3205515.1 hypothetical protein [Cupriavidus sp.]MCA3206904.1 hypothetical protein [Cupriavidus sp.]
MTLLTKASILAALDLTTADVEVPEWGGTVRVAMMSGKARDEFFARQEKVGGLPPSQFSATVLVATIVGEDGKQVFDQSDIEAMREKSPEALERVLAVALKLNGLGPKAAEEAEKNSSAAPSGDSGSVSPSPSESQ